jgi:hypothetical protein
MSSKVSFQGRVLGNVMALKKPTVKKEFKRKRERKLEA